MLMLFRRKEGQISGEYVLLISLISLAITAMTVYVRRTLQARMYDADRYMITTAASALGNSVLYEYEPYYKNQASDTDAEQWTRETTAAGATVLAERLQNTLVSTGDQKSPLQQ